MPGARDQILDQGTPWKAAQITLSAGWGSTATAALACTDRGGLITVSVAGSGIGADPTIVCTFADGAYDRVPMVTAVRGDTDTDTGIWRISSVTAKGFTATYKGTPTTGHTAGLMFSVR